MRQRFGLDPGPAEHAADEGPFVSFTDLFIGILFLFLILVAALMLMHQEAVETAKVEARVDTVESPASRQQLTHLQAKLDAAAKFDAERPPFRLAMVFNVYQAPPGVPAEWTFSRTVQVYRSPNNSCVYNVILRNNYSMAWKPPLDPNDIPTPQSADVSQMGTPCRISASSEYWDSSTETGGVDRVAEYVYRGISVLRQKDGDVRVQLQYRILAIYDDYFR